MGPVDMDDNPMKQVPVSRDLRAFSTTSSSQFTVNEKAVCMGKSFSFNQNTP
jgi:hypothetical protein